MLRLSRRNLLRGNAALAATKLFTPSIAQAGFALGKAGGGGGGDWILANGVWDDAGVWDDSAMWKDAA